MTPFEDLIQALGNEMGIQLRPDKRQSCRLVFPENIYIQIDLDSNADQILVGSELGVLNPGKHRELVLEQAMRINGNPNANRGVLAYSEKNNTLVLFQTLSIYTLTGQKLFNFIKNFHEIAKNWHKAILSKEVPELY